MRILLIQPFGSESNTNYPPMGLLYLASFVRSKTDYDLRIIDLRANKTPIEEKISEITHWSPDIVGVTGLSVEWSGIKTVINKIREALGNRVSIIAGGPHATIFRKMVLSNTPVNYIVMNEGEETFLELLIALEHSANVDAIRGLAIKKESGEIIETPDREPIRDIDTLPFPAYDLINIENYFRDPHFHGNLNKYNRVLPLITSRGCPFKCNFCYHVMGYSFRPRSVENILEEIDLLISDYGIREFQIEDDTFNFKIDRAKKIMSAIIDRNYGLSFAFPNGIKTNLIDQELIDLFKKAGVYRIHYGVETAVPRIQKIVNKPLDMDKLNGIFSMTSSANISSHGFFMMGFPTETEEEIMETIQYAAKSALATANFSILKIFPGTPFGDQYISEEHPFDDDFTFSYDSTQTNLSAVSDKRLKELQRIAMLKFYLRPSRIWRIFKTSPNKKKLFYQNIFTLLSLIFRGKSKY